MKELKLFAIKKATTNMGCERIVLQKENIKKNAKAVYKILKEVDAELNLVI